MRAFCVQIVPDPVRLEKDVRKFVCWVSEMTPGVWVSVQSEVPLRTMGSVSLVRNLMEAGLVNRLRLMVVR